MSDDAGAAFAGLATGIGSWPGTDIAEAVGIVVGELTRLPHVVELPARGLGADMIGRTGAMLVDIELDAATSGYRVSARRSATGRLAADHLSRDLDVLEEEWEVRGLRGAGHSVKVQAAGPFTLAAEVELATGHRALTDRGAVRDLAESLAEGLAVHAAEVSRRLGAEVVVQLDEPRIAAVLGGRVQGVTSLDRIPAIPAPEVTDLLSRVVDRLDLPVMIHTCDRDVPFEVFGRSGAAAVAFDLSLLPVSRYDALGEFVEAGGVPVLGLVAGSGTGSPPPWREGARAAAELIDRLGFARRLLRDRVSVAPRCGFAEASPRWAREASTVVQDVRRALDDDPDGV